MVNRSVCYSPALYRLVDGLFLLVSRISRTTVLDFDFSPPEFRVTVSSNAPCPSISQTLTDSLLLTSVFCLRFVAENAGSACEYRDHMSVAAPHETSVTGCRLTTWPDVTILPPGDTFLALARPPREGAQMYQIDWIRKQNRFTI
jgi:hypothetical protein